MTRKRTTTYRPDHADIARRARAAGACDEELAADLNISVATLYRWRAQHPDFAAASAMNWAAADDRVERALYQRAVGFEYQAERVFTSAHSKTPVVTHYTKRVAPDLLALQLIRRHRRKPLGRTIGEADDTQDMVEALRQVLRRIVERQEQDGEG